MRLTPDNLLARLVLIHDDVVSGFDQFHLPDSDDQVWFVLRGIMPALHAADATYVDMRPILRVLPTLPWRLSKAIEDGLVHARDGTDPV